MTINLSQAILRNETSCLDGIKTNFRLDKKELLTLD
jgi:hypothetical protein